MVLPFLSALSDAGYAPVHEQNDGVIRLSQGAGGVVGVYGQQPRALGPGPVDPGGGQLFSELQLSGSSVEVACAGGRLVEP